MSAVQTWSVTIRWRQRKEVVKAGLWKQSMAGILALFTFEMLLTISGPQFPHLENKDDGPTWLRGCCEGEMDGCARQMKKAAWHAGKAGSRGVVVIILCLLPGQQEPSLSASARPGC